MTDTSLSLIQRLRDFPPDRQYWQSLPHVLLTHEAADLIEQQAAEIAELKAELRNAVDLCETLTKENQGLFNTLRRADIPTSAYDLGLSGTVPANGDGIVADTR